MKDHERSIKTPLYGVVTADLVESRQLMNRAGAQDDLVRLISKLNTKFSDKLAAQFMVTLGDEIQGLLNDLSSIPVVVGTIHTAFHPSEISVGIGVGAVTTRLVRRVTEMDGPAFVNSRSAVVTAKKEELEVVVLSGDHLIDGILNAMYTLLGGIKVGWTRTQWERFNLYLELGKVEEVAKRLGVAKQSVSKSLRNTLWTRVLRVEKRLPEIFAALDGGRLPRSEATREG